MEIQQMPLVLEIPQLQIYVFLIHILKSCPHIQYGIQKLIWQSNVFQKHGLLEVVSHANINATWILHTDDGVDLRLGSCYALFHDRQNCDCPR
jgi:hypothetical protein